MQSRVQCASLLFSSMASLDLSLDDIIQKKYSKPSIRGRGGVRRGQQKRLELRGRGAGQSTANHVNKRLGLQGRRGAGSGALVGTSSSVSDARLRIIQKNRQRLTDARDKLVEIAKQSDARWKLEKLRESRMQGITGSKLPRGGTSITRKTGRNGQILLSTNKGHRQVMSSRGFRGSLPGLMDMDMKLDDTDLSPPPVIRRTVNNEMSALPPPPLFAPAMQHNLYTWVNPISQDPSSSSIEDLSSMHIELLRKPVLSPSVLHRSASQPASLKVTARNLSSQKSVAGLLSDRNEWHFDGHGSQRGNSGVLLRMDIEDSDDEGHVIRVSPPWRRSSSSAPQLPGRMSSELKARLDTPPVAPRTMGILSAPSNPPAAPPTPTGHRIVVSNLQPSVTHEDIRELFEDIGPLMTSRLVRPGTAEVVYQLHKDAVKAVDVYHNRQLDGQPMKCMLVNSRPPTVPVTGRAMTGGLRPSSSYKLPSGGKSSVVPDIATIHKALFNKS